MTGNDYTFGDNDSAARRLEALSDVFDPISAQFLGRYAPSSPLLCVEIGCGPGYSTLAMHRAVRPNELVALESSTRFIELARIRVPADVRVVNHDVTTPLPVSNAALIVSRFVLTHLHDPSAALSLWLQALAPSGVLMLEEMGKLESSDPTLMKYYELVTMVQRAAGQDIYIGQKLSTLVESAGGIARHFSLDVFEIPQQRMARLHELNLPTLRKRSVVLEQYTESELDELQSRLCQLSIAPEIGHVRATMARCVAQTASGSDAPSPPRP